LFSSKLIYAVLRYSNVYGPRQNLHGEAGIVAIFTKQMFDGKQSTIFGDGTRDYVYVGDSVNANISAMFSEADLSGEIYNPGWGKDIEVFEIVRDTLGS